MLCEEGILLSVASVVWMVTALGQSCAYQCSSAARHTYPELSNGPSWLETACSVHWGSFAFLSGSEEKNWLYNHLLNVVRQSWTLNMGNKKKPVLLDWLDGGFKVIGKCASCQQIRSDSVTSLAFISLLPFHPLRSLLAVDVWQVSKVKDAVSSVLLTLVSGDLN